MPENVEDLASNVKSRESLPDRYRSAYEDFIKGNSAQDRIRALYDLSTRRHDCELMSASSILYGYYLEETIREHIDFSKNFISQFWCPSHQDEVGFIQKYGQPGDIEFLEHIAMHSLKSWNERNDEMQQFFRKCVWAIGDIARRDHRGSKGLEALIKMAEIEPEIAAYWAKKQINLILGDKSPYATEDLSEPPEVDYDWPYE